MLPPSCVYVLSAVPLEFTKIPALSQRFHWLWSITVELGLWGEPVIKHLPLLMAAHFNSNFSQSPVALCLPAFDSERKRQKVLLK